MRNIDGLLKIFRNTSRYCVAVIKNFFLWIASFAKFSLFKRRELVINLQDDLDLHVKSWRIRRVILESDKDELLKQNDGLGDRMALLQQQFPHRAFFLRYPQCFQHAAFGVEVFLEKLTELSMDVKTEACLHFSKHIALNRFLAAYPFVKLYEPEQGLLKKILNYRVRIAWAAGWLFLGVLISGLFFQWTYQVDVRNIDEVKTLSQDLVSHYEDHQLSDTQRFQFFQDYYIFSRDFLAEHTVLSFVISEKLKDSMQNLLFTIIQKQYYQRLVSHLKDKLITFRKEWPQDKRIRGEYYADWLAYLDLLYPSHLLISAVDLQIKMIFDDIDHFPTALDLVEQYLRYVKDTQASPVVLLADPFFTSISNQLSPDSIDDLYALIYFLELKKLGTVSLDYFFKRTDILWSNAQLPALFLKDNFLNKLLPQLKSLSKDSGDYTWFSGVGLLERTALFDTLQQEFIVADAKAWRDFLSSINIRQTDSVLLASNFLKLLMDDQSDFKQFIAIANKNLAIDGVKNKLAVDWKQYNKVIYSLYQDSHYLLLNENTSLAAKDYALDVLSKGDTHLNQAVQWVMSMAAGLPDPDLALGLKHYLLAPLKFYWMTLLMNAKDCLVQQYQTQALSYYQQHLQATFPFSNSPEDAAPADVKYYLAPISGLFWQFLRNNLQGFIVLKKEWRLNTWLGLGLPVDVHFIDKTNQLWQFANAMFYEDNYHLALSLYPIPSPAIAIESFSIGDQLFSYQNGPQFWQSFLWQPDSPDNLLSVQYTAQNKVFTKTFKGHWALLRFLLDPSLDGASLALSVKPENLVTVLQNLSRDNALLLMGEGD